MGFTKSHFPHTGSPRAPFSANSGCDECRFSKEGSVRRRVKLSFIFRALNRRGSFVHRTHPALAWHSNKQLLRGVLCSLPRSARNPQFASHCSPLTFHLRGWLLTNFSFSLVEMTFRHKNLTLTDFLRRCKTFSHVELHLLINRYVSFN